MTDRATRLGLEPESTDKRIEFGDPLDLEVAHSEAVAAAQCERDAWRDIEARHLTDDPRAIAEGLSPYERGKAAALAGESGPPFPTPDSSWADRLHNRGWSDGRIEAASREVRAILQERQS